MPDAKPVIFISYCHMDEPKNPGANDVCWLTFVQSHLAPAVKHGIYELWVDEDIPGGGRWREEITRKLDECDVCVLLVSRHSLASDFIIDVEIDTLRKRREKGEVEIFPVVLTHCAVNTAPWIKEINLRPPNGKPLSDFEKNERDKQMAAIADEIACIANEIAKKKNSRATVAHDRLELGVRLDTDLSNTRISVGVIVDTAHLPETAYENLVGREAELKKLDDAWTESKTNILSLIAEGGAGKSALVNEWLKKLQADDYRGAETVLGWSFYSQGTKERATSAEQFLNWAIEKLGIAIETTSATAKGEAIADELTRRRVLLVLDGCEPLQHGLDKQHGELKDQGLRALLRRFASTPPTQTHGLIVLTSRLPIKDIARWKDGSATVERVDKLSDEAGAALLRDNGVWGTDKELKAASDNFGGHPLALGLLASYLREKYFGDVRQRGRVRGLLQDEENPRHDHAKRVMESYEKEWLAAELVEHAIMHMIGLFDRPASGDCLQALRRKPNIANLTDAIVDLEESEWRRAVARLRDGRLLAPTDPSAPDSLDAHPLVREWFGDRLKQTNEIGWKSAHGRLYEHLRDTTKESNAPTLEDLAPLYQAIAHGCRAERHQETLDAIYVDRICRRDLEGVILFHAIHKLGSLGSDLAAIFWFFYEPYESPVASLKATDQSWVLNIAAYILVAQGRFGEALPAIGAALRMSEAAKQWGSAAVYASNLAQAEVFLGRIAAAIVTAEKSVAYADLSRDKFQILSKRTTHAHTLYAAGRRKEAEHLLAEAERLQKDREPANPVLYSLPGFHYCNLMLARGEWAPIRDRVATTIAIARRNEWLLDIALDTLTLGRMHLGLALSDIGLRQPAAAARDNAHDAGTHLDGAVDGLRVAAQLQYLPLGLLARAVFRRSIGDWDSASRDLNEVEEIAEPGAMKLFLCDMALERARLAFAKIEAFAPLNGLVDGSPPKPAPPDSAETARLKDEAAKQLAIAADYIKTCGYHRRDEELAELQAVLRGEKKFADLPPRV